MSSPTLKQAVREMMRVLPAAFAAAALPAAWPYFRLPAWSVRASWVVGRAVALNVLLVAAAAVLVAFDLAARGPSGRVARSGAVALAFGLLASVPAASGGTSGLNQLMGRLAGLGIVLAAAGLPALRSRTVLRLGLAGVAAMLIGGVALAPPTRPDLVLVTVDTLRADRINDPSFADLAPNLQRFAREGVRFTRVWSTAPWTIPAMSSIFTGIHPSSHGAHLCTDEAHAAPLSRRIVAERAPQSPSDLFSVMTRRVETLPQALLRGGYVTGGFSDWLFVSGTTGFGRGFDEFVDSVHDDDGLLAARAAAWFRNARRWNPRPVFLFVHLFGPHQPYQPPPEDIPPASDPGVPLPSGCFDLWDAQLDGGSLAQKVLRREEPLPKPILEHISALYGGEVHSLDRHVGLLLAAIDENASSARGTLVAITADHGEFLGEKSLLDHGHFLYEPALRVPLLVRFPRSWKKAKPECALPVSSHDVYPTFLRAAGVTPTHRLSAEDLGGALEPSGSRPRRLVAEHEPGQTLAYLFGNRFAHAFEMVTDGRWKLIVTDGRTAELYDLSVDPAEAVDLSADEPRRVAGLRSRLEEFHASEIRYPSEGGATFSPEEAKRLRSLGYIR